MSDISIRGARQRDAGDIKSLLDRSWRTHWAPHLEMAALARYDAARPVEAYVDLYLDRFCVAERGDVVVGVYHLEDSHLHAIHVDSWAIGTGVGKALMAAAERDGARKLEVRAFNMRARDFYLGRGWVEVDEYEDLEMGQSVRTILMERI
jgi:N-acetylglutamate synthase-like GNAT family acetyltransferase